MNTLFLLTEKIIDSNIENKEKIDTIPILSYIFDVLVIMIIMCILVYLSFSIVKKSQMNVKFESLEIETKKIMQKIKIKNEIEIIQNGIVKIDDDSYILPARKNINNYIFDDKMPKIKHLNKIAKNENQFYLNFNLVNLGNDSNTKLDDINLLMNIDLILEKNNKKEKEIENQTTMQNETINLNQNDFKIETKLPSKSINDN